MILLFGYWPPTDIGIATRPGMLGKWESRQQNYNNSGYDVLAITPTFQNQIGWRDQAMTVPYWGKGTGQLMVDYLDTSEDFWAIVQQRNPIAIMSFSLGRTTDKSWELEPTARNLGQIAWTVSFPWYDDNGVVQPPETWDPPHAGGSAEDFSPFRGQGTRSGDPPDRSLPADSIRSNTLPLLAIEQAIKAEFPNPPGDIFPIFIDPTANVGSFLSGYMAYHVSWYGEYINALGDLTKRCEAAGHTHVGIQVAVADAETAVDIQLAELINVLP